MYCDATTRISKRGKGSSHARQRERERERERERVDKLMVHICFIISLELKQLLQRQTHPLLLPSLLRWRIVSKRHRLVALSQIHSAPLTSRRDGLHVLDIAEIRKCAECLLLAVRICLSSPFRSTGLVRVVGIMDDLKATSFVYSFPLIVRIIFSSQELTAHQKQDLFLECMYKQYTRTLRKSKPEEEEEEEEEEERGKTFERAQK